VSVPPAEFVDATLAELAGIARRHRLAGLEERCLTAVRQARDGDHVVAVLGQFKAGKSSLLNWLLGEDVLPVQAIPTTAVVTRVRYDDRLTARVKRRGHEPAAAPLGELGEWITQAGNPDNRRDVEWVEVRSPALADLPGLTLVDTPGTQSSWEANTATSLGWLPNAGAALVAVSATQPLAEADLRLLDLLRPHTPSLTIVLTKIDLLTPPDAREVAAHVRQQLAARLPNPPPVLPFSTRPGHAESRERLREHLRELDRHRAEARDALARHRIGRIAGEVLGCLELAQAAASGHDRAVADLRGVLADERTRLTGVRVRAQAQLRPTIQRIGAQADKLLGRQLTGLVRHVGSRLETAMPAWHGTLAGETRAFRSWLELELTTSLAPLVEATAAALAPLLEEGLESIRQTGEAFVQRLRARIETALGVELRLPVPTPSAVGFTAPEIHLNTVFDSHLELLSWAVPMILFRPLVHRHFRRTVGWQVEKNLYRAGYVTAGQASAALARSLDAYLELLAEQVDTYQRLAGEPSDLPGLERELATVRQLSAGTLQAVAASPSL